MREPGAGLARWPSPRLLAARHTAAALLLTLGSAAHALPSYPEVRQAHRPSDALLLDRHGEPLQRLRVDSTVRRGAWVPLADVSPALRHALLVSEDKRFYEHSGVDWQAVSAAAWGNLWATRTRGASTLTMQLAGLLDGDWRAGLGGRSVPQKLGQALAAQVLERRWRKDQILEAYLNLVPFRGELVGIDALSRHLFGKAPHGLDVRESALAVALLRGPNAPVTTVAQRACGVWRASQPTPPSATTANTPATAPDCAALMLFAQGVLARPVSLASDPDLNLAPHAARVVWAAHRSRATAPATTAPSAQSHAAPAASAPTPTALPSTLSAPLQRLAVNTLQQQLRELRGRNVQDGAVVVLDNATGEVLAWVGSSGTLSQAAQVDGVTAARQAGSTLKPFLYAQAMAERKLTAASLLDDSPTHITTAGGLYIPQNYDRQFKGWVSVRTALASSLNVPAVRTLVLVGPSRFAEQLRAVGLPLARRGDHYGYSLALGSAEVSLLNLTNAYRTLANGGRASPTTWALGSSPRFTPALDGGASFIVGDILSDPNARARTFGTDSLLATRHWSAVKTGTSKDMRDNWAVGYTTRHTVGVWVGNASGEPMHSVSGTTGAAPIWATLVQWLTERDPSTAPPPPPGVLQAPVTFAQEREAARREWFLAGTEQPQFALDSVANFSTPSRGIGTFHQDDRAPGQLQARILTPTNGSILALDPDIPPQRQRVHLSADVLGGAAAGLRWQVDGKPLARGSQALWFPLPGQHRIRITDGQGGVLDEVLVEVRGAGMRR